MAEPALHMLRIEFGHLENIGIRLKANESAVGFRRFPFLLILELALPEGGFDKLAFAVAAHEEISGKRVNSLGADPIEANTELKNIVVVLCTGVNLRDTLDDFAEGNAAPEIAYGHRFVLDADLHFLARTHDELVNGIINNLLQQNIAAVII